MDSNNNRICDHKVGYLFDSDRIFKPGREVTQYSSMTHIKIN